MTDANEDANAGASDDAPLLVLHECDGADDVIVFIHGLSGHPLDTWGDDEAPAAFAHRLADDFPDVAIATFDYPSSAQRIVDDPDLTFDAMVMSWENVLCEELLRRYCDVAIVAHCLGGTMTMTALRRLLTFDGVEDEGGDLRTERITVFLLDTMHELPAAGASEWIVGLTSALEFRAETFRTTNTFWHRRPTTARPVVETFAIVSSGECWVTPFRPDADLPESCIDRCPQSHVALTKAPRAGTFAPYDAVAKRLSEPRTRY